MADLGKLKIVERSVAHQIDDRPKRVVPPALQNVPGKPVLISTRNADALHAAVTDLNGKLYDWPTPAPRQKAIKKVFGRELETLDKILFDAKTEENIEDGYVAIPPTYVDPTSASAPSLDKLQAELKALGEETLSPELAGAIQNLTAKLDACFQLETEAKPQPPHAPHRHTEETCTEK